MLVCVAGCAVRPAEVVEPDPGWFFWMFPPRERVPAWITEPGLRRQWIEEPAKRGLIWDEHHC